MTNIYDMTKRPFLTFLALCGMTLMCSQCTPSETSLSLAGEWQFQKDSLDVGVTEHWFDGILPQTVHLPGTMWENRKGDVITLDTRFTGDIFDSSFYKNPRFEKYRQPGNVKIPFWLTPDLYYAGPAWYQKTVKIPSDWKGKRMVLTLERAHWETRLWVDGQEVGMRNSLSTPHVYNVTPWLTKGKHVLTLRVDNRITNINIGANSHSISEHTQGNWNGVVGVMEIRAGNFVYQDDVQVYPDVAKKMVRVVVRVKNATDVAADVVVNLQVLLQNGVAGISRQAGSAALKDSLPSLVVSGLVPAHEGVSLQADYPMGDNPELWSEFHPVFYSLQTTLTGSGVQGVRTTDFGMRTFSVKDRQFLINGNPIFLRGTLECNIFPLTGYASLDTASWARIYRIIKAHGLNHIRFHSNCPPEAAFEAADRAGVYLQVECGSWANQGAEIGSGFPLDSFIYRETERILKAYGNHPSFCMMAYGNEPSGRNSNTYLATYEEHFRSLDNRHLYTAAAGWPQIPSNDYHSFSDCRIQRWGEGVKSIINAKPPQTAYDFRALISQWDVPVVSHEIGQWCVFPNFEEMKKYTGPLKPRNFELFQEDLADHDMADQNHDFVMASGKLQALCYKADIEAQLRTPGIAGFQLLDLHDFPGQGTALVGILDPFWDEKGYITPAEFRRFCNQTVPLARMEKLIYTNDQVFKADLEVAHFGEVPLLGVVPSWKIVDASGAIVAEGLLSKTNIALGKGQQLGSVQMPLARFEVASKLTFVVSVAGYENQWEIWVYPKTLPAVVAPDVYVCSRLDDKSRAVLQKGGSVLFMAYGRVIKGANVATGFSTIFWNTAWTNGQAPHTMGILCDPKHPALAEFPTEYYSNWQWWEITSKAQALDLADYPKGFRPVVQWIHTWFENRKLGMVVEASVAGGKLLICTADIATADASRPAARQLYHSLLKYASSDAFQPKTKVEWETVRAGF